MAKVSVVIPAHNEGANLADTVGCVLDHADHEEIDVIVVDDSSTDGSAEGLANGRVTVLRGEDLGVAGARNLGGRSAQGDVIVFLDGHCYTPPGWLAGLVAALADPRVGVAGPAIGNLQQSNGPLGYGAGWTTPGLDMQWLPLRASEPYEVPLLPGGCHALRRDVFAGLGGYDAGMTRWGSEDHELCLRTWLAGYQVVVNPQAVIYHLFRQRHPYTVETAKVLYNRLRLAALHFSRERMLALMEHYQAWPGFSEAVLMLLQSDAMHRRRELDARRSRDDGCFFGRFGSPFGCDKKGGS